MTRFAAWAKNVMFGSEKWAVARSHTAAKRIAKALNQHQANREGV